MQPKSKASLKTNNGAGLQQPKKTLADLAEEQGKIDQKKKLRDQGYEPPVELDDLTKKEIRALQSHPIYKGISDNYDVEEVFKEWFGNFQELEKTDIWKKLPELEKQRAIQAEQDRLNGTQKVQKGSIMRAFDDLTDEDNLMYLPQELRKMSKPKPLPSENSMSSGDGDYELEAAKIDLSDDEDLARIKVLTKDRETKQQLQIDLDRIAKHQLHGPSKNDSQQEFEIEKDDKPDFLQAEQLAVTAALKTGKLDLYKRAMQINEKTAKYIVAIAHGEKAEPKPEEDIISDLTDDEEFNQEVRHLALGDFNLSKVKAFDPDESYFSEDADDAAMDDVMKWQKDTQEMKFSKGGFMTPIETFLMNSGYQTRESAKASRLHLNSIGTKVTNKLYNAKAIIRQIKEAGLKGNMLEVSVAQNELQQLEKDGEKEGLIANQLNNKTDDGTDRYTEKNRLFSRNLDESKMYTDRYVRRLKVAQNKLMDKFTLGSKYALKAQKNQIMSRASRLVTDSHNQLLESFQNQAMTLLYQCTKYKEELELKTEQCDNLLLTNRSLEIDLSTVLRQNDYMEARVPKIMKTFQGYKRQDIKGMELMDSEYALEVAVDKQCELPDQSNLPPARKFQWEQLSVEDRCRRADLRSHIICEFENMEPNMTSHAFDFYGAYVRISEGQKYKYAEGRLIQYYKALVDEVMTQNEQLKDEVDLMININKKYEFNEEEVKQAMKKEKDKRDQLQHEIETQKVLYEGKIAEIVGNRHEEKMDITDFYTKQIDYIQAELKTSNMIRDVQTKNIDKLKKEIETLAKIVKTSRNHFKELEKCDLEALGKQVDKYESKIAMLQVCESEVETMRATKAKKRITETQKKAQREDYNKVVKRHHFNELKKPIDEKPPKKALKELWDKKRPKLIHERLPGPPRDTSLEDVLVEKRNQALQYLDVSIAMNTEVVKSHDLDINEDSLTEPSIEAAFSGYTEEIFQTAKHTSTTNQNSLSLKTDSMGERMRITVRKKNSGQDGFEPFTSSKQDLESEREMLIGTGTDDINNYLLQKLGNSNRDLIVHDQILISEHGVSAQVDKVKKRDNIQLASMTDSQQSYQPNQRSRTQLKRRQFPAMTVTDETDETKKQPWKRDEVRQMKINLDANILKSKLRGKTADRFTVTADSSVVNTDRMLNTTTPNSGRLKNFSIEDESFGHDSITRLQTANHLIGMPRRDPLRHKIIPKLQGVMGGEKAQQALVTLDAIVHGGRGPAKKLPKISDVRFTNFKKRAASIPPKTAAAGPLISPNNVAVLQSLVNNNAFLGRGKFSNRGHSIAMTPNNQPMSPPSISIKGTGNVLQLAPHQHRGNKFQVKLPGTTTATHTARKNTNALNDIAMLTLADERQTSLYKMTGTVDTPVNNNPNNTKVVAGKRKLNEGQQTVTMEMAAEISEAMHDATFSISKLNLPSSAGNGEILTFTRRLSSDSSIIRSHTNMSRNQSNQNQKDSLNDGMETTTQLAAPRLDFSQLEGGYERRTPVDTNHDNAEQSVTNSKDQSSQGFLIANDVFAAVREYQRHEDSKGTMHGQINGMHHESSMNQTEDGRQYLSQTPLTTIEIKSDPFGTKDNVMKDKKGSGDRKKRPGSKSNSPRKKQRPTPQPIKKSKVKMVTPAKTLERAEKEKKQNKLKSQLENAAPAKKQ